MTCREVDEFHNSESAARSPTDPEIEEHLQTCASCRKLQSALNALLLGGTVQPEVESRITRNILQDLRPVSPLPPRSVLVATLLALALLSAAIGVYILGDAGWHALSPLQAAGVFTTIAGALVIMARIVIAEMIPGSRYLLPVVPTVVVICLSLILVVIILVPYHRDDQFFTRGLRCLRIGFGSSLASALLFASVLRYGAWFSPVRLGVLVGFLSGLVGLLVLEVFCSFLDRAHVGIWHIGSVLCSMLVGYCLGFVTPKLRRR